MVPFLRARDIGRMRVETGASIEDVYRGEAPRLWRALLLHLGDREAASDALAEAFAQAIARGDAIRDPAAWVWKAAFRLAKGRPRERPITTPPQEYAGSGTVSDELMDLVQALKKLTPHQRGAVVLHHYAGYSVREIADILGSTPAAVGVHLYRARGRLRRELGVDDDRPA